MRRFLTGLSQWIEKGLRRKLVFWSIGFWIIAVSILSTTFLIVGRSEAMNETRQRNVQIASVISRDVNFEINTILTDTRTFARHLEILNPDLENQASTLLTWRLSAPQRYRAIYYFNINGDLLLHLTDTLSNLLAVKDSRDIVFNAPIELNKEIISSYEFAVNTGTFISDVYFTGIDRVPVAYLAMPLNYSTGEHRVVVIQIDLRDIWQRINQSTVGTSGLTYAVSGKGIIIAHPILPYIGRQIALELNPMLVGYEGFTEYYEPFRHKEVFAAYSPVVGSTDWGIVVEQDASEALAPVYRAGLVIMMIWLGLAIIGTVGIMLMAHNFTRPITELTEVAQKIALTGELTGISLEPRTDEVGQLSHSFDQMIQRLQTTENRVASAAADERNRLARDLHDAVSQTLFSASLIADVLPRLWERNNEEGLRRLEEVRQLTKGALAEMRTLLLELRPAALVEAELPHLLQQLGESISGRSRVPVSVSIDGNCELPTDVKVALYRIAQEALNNIAKHSGAREASVSLTCAGNKITLKIRDDGRGFDLSQIPTNSLGLGIMRERASNIGANLSVESEPGKGTEIIAVWIISEEVKT